MGWGGSPSGGGWGGSTSLSSSYSSQPALPVGASYPDTSQWAVPIGQPTPTKGGGSNWFGSITDPFGVVSAAKQLGGGLASGVGKIVWRAGETLENTGYNLAADVSGHSSQANWGQAGADLAHTAQGVGSFAVGLPLALESLTKTAGHIVGGADLANMESRDIFQPFNRFMSRGIGYDQFGVQKFNQAMGPETAQALRGVDGKGMVPVDAIQEAKQGGLGAAAMYTGAQAAMVLGPVAGVSEAAAGFAGDAADTATQAGDAEGAAKWAARQARLQTFAESMRSAADIADPTRHIVSPFQVAWRGAADFFGAQRAEAFPPMTTVRESTPMEPQAMEPVPTEVAVHRDLMDAEAASAQAMHEMAQPPVSNTGYQLDPELQAALAEAEQSYTTKPYEEPPVPRGMKRLYSSSDDPSLWTDNPDRAANPPGAHAGGVNVRHIDVPVEEAKAMQATAESPADAAARAAGHQTNPASDYYLTPGEMSRFTPEEHVPSIERTVQVEATKAEAPVEPERYNVGKNQPLTPEEKASREEIIRQETAAARNAVRPDLYVMDEMGKRLALPPPRWATWLAETMPDSWNRALAHMGGGFFDKVRLRAVLRNAEQAMQTAQQQARTSEMYQAGQDAATQLLSRTTGRATAAARVGEEINFRLTTQALQDMWRDQHNGFTPSDAQKAVLNNAAKRGYLGVTDEMLQSMPSEDRIKFQESINAAVDAYKVQAQQTYQTLLATRYGARGLEAAILDPDGAQWTPDQKRLFNRVLRDERMAAKARERVPNEVARRVADAARAEALGIRAHGFVDQLRARLGLTLQTVESLWRGIPKGLEDDAQRTIGLTQQTLAQEGGAYMDIGSGTAVHPTDGIYVPIQQQFDMPMQDWIDHGAQALHEAIFQPVAGDGQAYRDSLPWENQDARLSVNIVNGLDGTQRVVGTLAMNTINGDPIQPWQAFLLGSAHEQVGGYNFANGNEVSFTDQPMEQTLAKHYVTDVLDSKSDLTRWAKQRASMIDNNPDLHISPNELNNEMLANLWLDKVMQMRNGQWAQGDIFKTDVSFAKGEPTLAYLAQTIMPELSVGEHVDQAVSMYNAEDVNKMLAWYYKSHDFIEQLYRGKTIPLTGRDAAETMYDLIALTSVMASPTQNLGRALMGLSNLDEFLSHRQAAYDNAKATVDELLNQATKDPAERAYVRDLNKPTEREVGPEHASERGVTVVSRRWLNSPELRELSKGTSMVTSPKYRILDAILGNLNLATATSEQISGQPEWWMGDRVLLSDNNLSPEAVMHHAQLLGADQTPTYQRYVDWAQQHAQLVQAKEENPDSVTNAALSKSEAAGRALAKSPDLSRAYENALMEVHGSSALAKLRSFRENLAFPHTTLAVTLDSIMAQLFGFEKTHWNVTGEYAKYADLIRESASQWSDIAGRQVMPHEIQALLWVYAKRYIGERDWGRLLAHTQNLHDQVQSMEDYAKQGHTLDIHDFHPYDDWWNQELRYSEDMLAVRGERKALKIAAKAGTITPGEMQDRLDYLNNLPERRSSDAQFVGPDGTMETGIRDETYYDKKVLNTKQEQRAKFEQQYAEPIRQAVQDGDWQKAHELIDKAAITRKASILGEAPGTEFNAGMLKPGSKGLDAINKLRQAQYIPSPNEEALGTSELYDSFKGRVRGATIVNDNRIGRIMMRMFATGDVSTLLHEDLHAFRMMAPGNDVVDFERAYPGIQDPLTKGGFMTPERVASEEKFVGDFMNYLRLRRLNEPYGGPLGRLFNMVADAMDTTYNPSLATIQGHTIPNEMVNYWDSIFNADLQHPDAYVDPLRAEYAGRNLRPVPLVGESEADFTQRVRQYGEARGQAQVLQERVRDAEQRAVKADNFARRMQGMLLEPTSSEIRANQLEARAARGLDKVETGLANATGNQVPVAWRPYMEAIDLIREEIKKDPSLAPLAEEIPKNFAAAIQHATGLGFDPAYIPTITWDMAQKYLWGHLRLDTTADESGMRMENRGSLDRQKLGDHTLNALGTGNVMAMKELIQSELVGHVENSYGYRLPADSPLPEGWRFWSVTRDAILTGRKLDGTEGRVAVGGEQTIIPEVVYDTLRKYQSEPRDLPFRTMWKGAPNAVWKALILTYSTTWYIKHFIGAVTLATLEGVRWSDWRTAFNQWRTNTLPDTVRGREFMPTYDEEAGYANSGMSPRLFTHPVQAIGGELSQMRDEAGPVAQTAEGVKFVAREVNRSLKNVVKTVDSLARAAVYARAVAETGDPSFAAWRSYEAIGDFGRLSPIERSLVTQIMPFYGFQKAMWRLLMRLPIDHPVAASLAFQAGLMNQAYVKNKLGGLLPDAYLGSVFENGKLVQLDKLNPLTDSYKIMTPDGLAASVNPFLQLFGQQALHSPAFNAVPGISSTGQLVPQQDLLKGLTGIYSGSVPGVGSATRTGTDMVNPTNTLSAAQLASLQKRIQKDLQAQQSVKDGGYLTNDIVMPKGTSGSSGWGGAKTTSTAHWGSSSHRSSRVRSTFRIRKPSTHRATVHFPKVHVPKVKAPRIRLTSSFGGASHHKRLKF